MRKSASYLSEKSRKQVADALNASLADGIDLYTQIKVAHWNIKGAGFAALHPLLDSFASAAAEANDTLAERAVTLGEAALGTARYVAKISKISEYPQNTTKDTMHVKLLVERIEEYLKSLRKTQEIAEKNGDINTVDMLTQIMTDFEKNAWFLFATLDQ